VGFFVVLILRIETWIWVKYSHLGLYPFFLRLEVGMQTKAPFADLSLHFLLPETKKTNNKNARRN
jgi:hypothetical protein